MTTGGRKTRAAGSRRRFLRGVAAVAATAALPRARVAGAEQPPAPAAGAGAVRFGVLARQGASWDETLALWRSAERLGFDTAFVNDHFMGIAPGPAASQRCFEAWALLSALAVETRRIRVGVLVTDNTFRYPAVVAKMAVTVDHVSRGRLILGMGAGWLERENAALGVPFYTAGGRARRLVEAVEVVKRLLTQETSTFAGKYYTLRDAPCEPKAIQRPHPPILIGGLGPKVVQPLAARHAQIWHFLPPSPDPAAVAKLCAGFDRICAAVGRDPREVEKAISLLPNALAAPAPEQRTRLRALVAAGVRHFVLPPLPAADERATLRRFAADVMPAVREG